ncbi:MAG: hypothetical protein SF028_01140 [Candidatus Sumerlaeia bacterium]|nr:hypothetical protein [Candidatus Sumerlaeia bacterium]
MTAPRSRKKSGPLPPWKAALAALAAGLVAGYAWRSYSPLPIPGSSELSGSDTAELYDELRDLRSALAEEQARAALYSERAERLEGRAEAMQQELTSVEAEIADKQLRDLLKSGGAARP